MEVSRRFLWVFADRDASPELPKTFNVSAYPTLLTIEPKGQRKIHRFSGYSEAGPFKERLGKALARWELFKAGKEWDDPDPRPERICDVGDVETIPAPSEAVPGGIVVLDGALWVGQEGKLFKLDPKTGEVRAKYDLEGVDGLGTDGKRLYALKYGWTMGEPIRVIDPETGRVEREIVTEENRKNKYVAARGVAWRDGKLEVFDGNDGLIHAVDPETGKLAGNVKAAERWVAGLAFDGTHYIVGGATDIFFLDPATGAVARKIPVNYRIRSLAWDAGTLYVFEQPVTDFDKDHKSIRLWPKETKIWKLRLPAPGPK